MTASSTTSEAVQTRDASIRDFLARAGWGAARRQPLTADASTRRYERLFHGDRIALLMDAPPKAEAAPCPPGATEADRLRLGYNAAARLAGPDSRRFAAFASELRHLGLSAPDVLDAEYDQGLLLIEDLGDDLFARAVAGGVPPEPLYEAAIDVLNALHETPAPSLIGRGKAPRSPLLTYDRLAYAVETELLIEWLYPMVAGEPMSDALMTEYRAIWSRLFRRIAGSDPVIVLRDYHAENVFWLPERDGLARIGVIDFQDGLCGHRAYDLMSLLEDARRDVAPDLADAMLLRYIAGARARDSDFDADAFRADAALLGCQRNAKILGIFARLYRRDGKPKYLSFIPRLWRYVERDLENPSLVELKAWFAEAFPAPLRIEPIPV